MVSIDEATRLTPEGPGRYQGSTSPEYWNLTGPFGGWGAALALRAVLDDPRAHGEPIAMTVQFMGSLDDGPVLVTSAPVRANRTTSFWQTVVGQAPGEAPPAILAMTTLGLRRESAGHQERKAPALACPEDLEVTPRHPHMPAFFRNYELRYAMGAPLPKKRAAHNALWLREEGGVPLSIFGLTAMGDLGFPVLWNYIGEFCTIATVSYTAHFHATSAELAALGNDFVLLEGFGRRASHGFYDQTALLWSRDGALLASTDQMVWFRTKRS